MSNKFKVENLKRKPQAKAVPLRSSLTTALLWNEALILGRNFLDTTYAVWTQNSGEKLSLFFLFKKEKFPPSYLAQLELCWRRLAELKWRLWKTQSLLEGCNYYHYHYEEALVLQEQYFCLDDKLKEIFLKGEEVTCKENSTLVALQSVLQAFLTLRVVWYRNSILCWGLVYIVVFCVTDISDPQQVSDREISFCLIQRILEKLQTN